MTRSAQSLTASLAPPPAQFWSDLVSQEAQRSAEKAAAAAMPRFRISADWKLPTPGGFTITKPFASMREAERWAKDRAQTHADAVISVKERPSDLKLAAGFGGESFELATARTFIVDGAPCTLADFLSANADDPDACEWARSAKPGDHYPAFVSCECAS